MEGQPGWGICSALWLVLSLPLKGEDQELHPRPASALVWGRVLPLRPLASVFLLSGFRLCLWPSRHRTCGGSEGAGVSSSSEKQVYPPTTQCPALPSCARCAGSATLCSEPALQDCTATRQGSVPPCARGPGPRAPAALLLSLWSSCGSGSFIRLFYQNDPFCVISAAPQSQLPFFRAVAHGLHVQGPERSCTFPPALPRDLCHQSSGRRTQALPAHPPRPPECSRRQQVGEGSLPCPWPGLLL